MPAHEKTSAATAPKIDAPGSTQRTLTPAAQRALAEASVRRKARAESEASQPLEKGGRAGPDPVRYGDWENGGIASDF